ncbi:MAG TPA: glycosyltransferase family 2 protein, partial [Candidatus Brocadiia bacterium]|nr:glycosyltransferase family 2 protein [Candidatus Brocadiia bacterium]
MWKSERVSVVLPTYNEKDSIRQCVLDFFGTGLVDEVIVVNNNAAPGTSEAVAGTGAREVMEPVQGYGAAMRRGLREAQGDLVAVCEPDGTFCPNDLHKLAAYSDDFDYVIGTRTTREMVWEG